MYSRELKDNNLLVDKKLFHNKLPIAIIAPAVCGICGEKILCLRIDSTEGEYPFISICKECIDASFKSVPHRREKEKDI